MAASTEDSAAAASGGAAAGLKAPGVARSQRVPEGALPLKAPGGPGLPLGLKAVRLPEGPMEVRPLSGLRVVPPCEVPMVAQLP